MLMTEKEATNIWCPSSRVLLPINQSGNRVSSFQMDHADARDREFYEKQIADCNCIGSRCAMWRWSGTYVNRIQSESTRQGFCGLAGKPLELG